MSDVKWGITIRPYATGDDAGIRALHDRTPPAGSMATGPQPWPPDLDRIPDNYLAFWVATTQPVIPSGYSECEGCLCQQLHRFRRTGKDPSPAAAAGDSSPAFGMTRIGSEQIVGMVGLVAPGADVPREVLRGRADLVRLQRMRIAPEHQRQGIGAQLVNTVVAWARQHDVSEIILETTAQQAAAVALYRAKGFVEITRSIAGPYELIWLALPIPESDIR